MWVIVLIVLALIGYAWYMLVGRYPKTTFEECVDRCLGFMDDFEAAWHHKTLTEPQKDLAVKKASQKHAVRFGAPGRDEMRVFFPVCVDVTMKVASVHYTEDKNFLKRVALNVYLDKKYRGYDLWVSLDQGWMTERKAATLDTGYRIKVRIKGHMYFSPYQPSYFVHHDDRFSIVPASLHWKRID